MAKGNDVVFRYITLNFLFQSFGLDDWTHHCVSTCILKNQTYLGEMRLGLIQTLFQKHLSQLSSGS